VSKKQPTQTLKIKTKLNVSQESHITVNDYYREQIIEELLHVIDRCKNDDGLEITADERDRIETGLRNVLLKTW
jgi:hypothetical protein